MQRIALLMRHGSMLLLLALAVPQTGRAEIYKFVDDKGVVNYTNIAPAGSQKYQILRFPCYAADPKCRNVSWDKIALNTQAFDAEIHSAAQRNAVDESLIRAIIHAESACHPDAVSPKGAQGLMQLMPATQDLLEVSDPFNPAANIAGGVRHLSDLMQQFGGDISLVAAAYNAGAGAVQKYGGIPPYDETREYVRRVTILHRRYQRAAI